ncbi:hypothetical protein EJ02DRAFT_414823, partial [Clathrospora elynae]
AERQCDLSARAVCSSPPPLQTAPSVPTASLCCAHYIASTSAHNQNAQASSFHQHCNRLEREGSQRPAHQTPRLQHTASKPATIRHR